MIIYIFVKCFLVSLPTNHKNVTIRKKRPVVEDNEPVEVGRRKITFNNQAPPSNTYKAEEKIQIIND